MKQIFTFLLLAFFTSSIKGQNVGINVPNPDQNLHIRTDSSSVALRMDNTKSVETGVNYFMAIGTPSAVQNFVMDTAWQDWSNLDHTKLIASDNIRLNSPQLSIWPDAANSLRISFNFGSAIPTNATIYDAILNIEWKRNGITSGEMRITNFNLLQASNSTILMDFGFQKITSNTDVQVAMPFKNLYNPISANMLNSNDLLLGIQGLHSVNSGLCRLEIDKLWIEVAYYVPANGNENVYWTTGAKDGNYSIANFQNLQTNKYLTIDESGITQLKGLKLSKNAGSGKVLTSNNEGRAFWAELQSQEGEFLWLNKNDTAYYASGPVQIHNKLGDPALIFDKGDTRLNNGSNLIETDNRKMNIILDANNNQDNEQFNLFKDSTEFLNEDPAIRLSLADEKSWILASGNLGIGTKIPSEKLEINGALKIGTTSESYSATGTIRWNSAKKDFEGFNGAKWLPFSSNAGWGDKFGNEFYSIPGGSGNQLSKSVDIDNTYAIAQNGSAGNLGTNIYEYDGSEWLQVINFSQNVFDVAIDGDYAITSQPGYVGNIYYRDNGIWTLQDTINKPVYNVDIDINTLVVSNYIISEVYVYIRNGTDWVQQAQLIPSDGTSMKKFGQSVAISGDYIIVGSIGQNMSIGDAAYVFHRSGTTWTEQAKLLQSDPQVPISGLFGYDVDINGQYAIVGAYSKPVNGIMLQGSAYIFKRMDTIWSEQTILNSSITDNGLCGFSVNLNEQGTYALMGCPNSINLAINGKPPGRTHVFARYGAIWSEEAILTPSNSEMDDAFGFSTAIQGNSIIIGAPGKDNEAGKLFFYQNN